MPVHQHYKGNSGRRLKARIKTTGYKRRRVAIKTHGRVRIKTA